MITLITMLSIMIYGSFVLIVATKWVDFVAAHMDISGIRVAVVFCGVVAIAMAPLILVAFLGWIVWA